jgi:hypothetical protein
MGDYLTDMTPIDIAYRRLRTQRLEGEPAAAPRDVVQWLGAVQAQDYGPAKWSLGARSAGCTDAHEARVPPC